MAGVPVQLQAKLPDLVELLQYKEYVDDAQILFGAIGDATYDKAPLQVGQFESDNRMEDHLANVLLERGGGGTYHESYELAMYYMARHISADCTEKRDHKGYLFIIGDEHAYPVVKADEVRKVIGDDLAQDIPTPEIVKELTERWEVFFILPAGTSHFHDPELREYWQNLVGEQRLIILDDPNTVAEVVALQVGISENTIKLEEGIAHLNERGVDPRVISTVEKALA